MIVEGLCSPVSSWSVGSSASSLGAPAKHAQATFSYLVTCPTNLLPFQGSDSFCCWPQIACGDLKGGFQIGQEGSSDWTVFGIPRPLDSGLRQHFSRWFWRKPGQFIQQREEFRCHFYFLISRSTKEGPASGHD